MENLTPRSPQNAAPEGGRVAIYLKEKKPTVIWIS